MADGFNCVTSQEDALPCRSVYYQLSLTESYPQPLAHFPFPMYFPFFGWDPKLKLT